MCLGVSKEQYEAGFDAAAKGKQKKKDDDDNKVSLRELLSTNKSHYLVPLTNELVSIQPKRDRFSGLSRKLKRRKMAKEEDEEMGDEKALNAAIRSAKKSARPNKIGVLEKRVVKLSKGKAKKSARKVTARTGGAFDRDLGQKASSGGGRTEGVRAKKSDAVGGMGKKKGGKRKGK